MTFSDPIADLLATIRNGQLANLAKVSTPASTYKESVLNVLKDEGFIRDYRRVEVRKGINRIEIELKYVEGQAAIKKMHRVSKPGRRDYAEIRKLLKVHNGLGISILSTSQGVLPDYEARRRNIGGEVICSVF